MPELTIKPAKYVGTIRLSPWWQTSYLFNKETGEFRYCTELADGSQRVIILEGNRADWPEFVRKRARELTRRLCVALNDI